MNSTVNSTMNATMIMSKSPIIVGAALGSLAFSCALRPIELDVVPSPSATVSQGYERTAAATSFSGCTKAIEEPTFEFGWTDDERLDAMVDFLQGGPGPVCDCVGRFPIDAVTAATKVTLTLAQSGGASSIEVEGGTAFAECLNKEWTQISLRSRSTPLIVRYHYFQSGIEASAEESVANISPPQFPYALKDQFLLTTPGTETKIYGAQALRPGGARPESKYRLKWWAWTTPSNFVGQSSGLQTLQAQQVVLGMAEVLPMLQPGYEYLLEIPAAAAYGDIEHPQVPAGSSLTLLVVVDAVD